MIVRLKSGKQSLSVLFPLLFGGDNARRWRGATQVVDVPMQGDV